MKDQILNNSLKMKAILEFNLPEDNEEFTMATKASSYSVALWDINQFLRSEIKYNEQLSEDAYDEVVKIREKFHDILNDHNISLD